MSKRFFEVALGTVTTAVAAIVFLAPAPAAAQTSSTGLLTKEGTRTYTPPRTPDGKPDLQGIYSNASVVPLERPKDLGSKEFFTKEEADAYEKAAMSRHEVVAPGTYGDVHYNMQQFGLEKGQTKVAETIRTSLIVGPEGARSGAAARRSGQTGRSSGGHQGT